LRSWRPGANNNTASMEGYYYRGSPLVKVLLCLAWRFGSAGREDYHAASPAGGTQRLVLRRQWDTVADRGL
jgi:hypothetical protein